MKYIFWILILFLSCKEKKTLNCYYPNWKMFPIYKNTASINLPEKLLETQDTLINRFEYDGSLIYICHLSTFDSLSSVFIKIRNNPLPNKIFVDYVRDLQNHYKSLFKFSDSNYSNQQIDTLKNRRLFKFIFLSKQESNNIAFGGLIFYVNQVRFEVLIKIDDRNFDNIQRKLECILSSLTISSG